MKLTILLMFMTILQGCAYSVYTKKLENPVERKERPEAKSEEKYLSIIDCTTGAKCTASIGDTIFVVNRYIYKNEVGGQEKIVPRSPTSQQFPENSLWMGTHLYNDGKSGDLIVFTTPDYHHGGIGIILDSNEKMATTEALVQVDGRKIGRRWNINQRGDFFATPSNSNSTNIDSWALRYGGTDNKNLIFEIIKSNESKVTEILQRINITENDFSQGITIRDVKIKGRQTKEIGVIEYTVTDTLLK
ncbi:MAG: hypothetical protein AAGC78_15975 [Cellvibrio sp.]|uniref:hypothetical protein n=1 Tax=Cellvibrio sp. TaxID=1965322 RepID=UPI0031AC5FF1